MEVSSLRGHRRRLRAAVAAALLFHAGVALLIEISGVATGRPEATLDAGYPVLQLRLTSVPEPDAEQEPAAAAERPAAEQSVTEQSTTEQLIDERPAAESPGQTSAAEMAESPVADPGQGADPGQEAGENPGERAEAETVEGAVYSPLRRSRNLKAAQAAVAAAGRKEAARKEAVSLSTHLGALVQERKVYPEAARRGGDEGQVILRVRIHSDGRLRGLEVMEASAGAVLVRAAERLVRSVFPLADAEQFDALSCRLTVTYRLR